MNKFRVLFVFFTLIALLLYTQKEFIKEFLLANNGFKSISIVQFLHDPVTYIKEIDSRLSRLERIEKSFTSYHLDMTLKKQKSDLNFSLAPNSIIENENFKFKKFVTNKKIAMGIMNKYPGSSFLEVYKNKLYLFSSSGLSFVSSLKTNGDKFSFKQIDNNISNLINEKKFASSVWFSIKDLAIIDDHIYLSYTKELYDDCWNTSIMRSKLDYSYLNFEDFYIPHDCANFVPEKFDGHQSGGRIVNFDKQNILFSIGSYKDYLKPQDLTSSLGKIIKINKKNGESKIFSLGHRNVQGLYVDHIHNIVISTEHGPMGGDEINLTNLENYEVNNFGWPISSYGEHYNLKKVKNAPLYKSHSKFGFIEPLIQFTPSLGLSEINYIEPINLYVLSTLASRELVFLKNINNIKMEISSRMKINERIRDIRKIDNENYILYLESSGSLGLLSLKHSN